MLNKIIARLGMIVFLGVAGSMHAATAREQNLILPEVKKPLQVDLMSAFQKRRSTRAFQKDTALTRQELALLLWAGYGMNRPDGKRTVATARGKDLLDLYVLLDTGIYRYDPRTHILMYVADDDIRTKIGRQEFVAAAAVVIVLVGKTGMFPGGTPEQEQAYINYTAGAASENIYLAAAAMNLGTVVAASFDDGLARTALRLTSSQQPLYIMPVGHLQADAEK